MYQRGSRRTITTFDVARGASVSRVTVSRVLNNHLNVTEEVRQRVLQVAIDLGYIRQRSTTSVIGVDGRPPARAVRLLRTLGFVFTSIHAGESVAGNPFWSAVLHGVEQEATAAAIAVTYRSVDQNVVESEVILDWVARAHLDGLLLVGPASQTTLRTLQQAGGPLVLVDNYVAGSGADAVLSDNFVGGRIAVSHLIELGHQHIAFIGGPFRVAGRAQAHCTNTVWSIEQRALGYWTALREAGIQPDVRLYEGDNLGTAGGLRACQRLLATGRPFTAIFCANDESAVGAIQALHQAGLSVPTDVSVVGFDDIDIAQHLIPPLTTVRVDKEAIGAWAVQRLVARALAPDALPATICLQTELVVRQSTAAPRRLISER